MYCSTCGVESIPGLSYCNRCGASLNPSALTTQVIHTGSLTKPLVALGLTTLGLTLGGFAMIFIAAGDLALRHAETATVNLLLSLGLVTILITDFLLMRQLSRVISATLQPKPAAPAYPQPLPAQFAKGERGPRQINTAPPDYISPSVTEHTTRTLEPSFKEPGS